MPLRSTNCMPDAAPDTQVAVPPPVSCAAQAANRGVAAAQVGAAVNI